MKLVFKSVLLGVLMSSLNACTFLHHPAVNHRLSQETWKQQMTRTDATWKDGTDRWFNTLSANQAEMQNEQAPYSATIGTMSIRVPDFTRVYVQGALQVQLFGADEKNSVYLYGPYAEIRQIVVKVRNDTLFISQLGKHPTPLRHVIIRIGVTNLHRLWLDGESFVEGVSLKSDGFCIRAEKNSLAYLSGPLRLQCIDQRDTARLTLFGVNAYEADIEAKGNGWVRVSGQVGLHSVKQSGKSDVAILGAYSTGLRIDAHDAGTVSILGRAINLQKVKAAEKSRVWIDGIASHRLEALAVHEAEIGLLGRADIVKLEAMNAASIFARTLIAHTLYARTSGNAHMNVNAVNKAFLDARNRSSIYFFGPQAILSSFADGDSTVLAMRSSEQNRASAASSISDNGDTLFYPRYEQPSWRRYKDVS